AVATTPDLAFHLLRRLALRTRALAERLEHVTTQPVQARLAAHLLERASQAAGPAFGLGSTQAELAEEVGSVREVVVRELRGLCRQGALVARGHGRYQIGDRRLLGRIARTWN